MDFLDKIYMFDVIHAVSQNLIIPTILLLFAFLVYTIYNIGSVLIEGITEHGHYKVVLPKIIADIDQAAYKDLPDVINKSGLLLSQRLRLFELVRYMYLPTEARTEVAKRLLYDQNMVYQKGIAKTDVMSKIAPMLGLMGTLIPLGPGIVALGSGDTAALAQSLNIAFDSTIAGLVTAAVCFAISRVRKRWYADYLISFEGVLNTLLEKAQMMQDSNQPFDQLKPEDFPSYTDTLSKPSNSQHKKAKSADKSEPPVPSQVQEA